MLKKTRDAIDVDFFVQNALPIAAAVVLGLVILILIKKLVFGFARGNRILITGLSGSGKTLLWSKLCWNGSPGTVTSQKENVATFVNVKRVSHDLGFKILEQSLIL